MDDPHLRMLKQINSNVFMIGLMFAFLLLAQVAGCLMGILDTPPPPMP